MDLKDTHEDWKSEAPFLAELEKKNPFTVPTDYFEQLTDDIQAAVSVQKLKEENLYEAGYLVPDGYFDSLGGRISKRLASEEVTSKKRNSSKTRLLWTRYAAAASVVLILSVAAVLKIRDNSSIEGRLHRIPGNEIITYLQLYSDRSDTPVIIENLGPDAEIFSVSSDLSKDEIEEYINTVGL